MTAILGMAIGTHVEIVGVEDDPEGGLRIYLGHRAHGIYAVLNEGEEAERVRREWENVGQRIVIERPPASVLCQDASVSVGGEAT